jgi:5-(carboxyamino)imidazole ribonucleotide mutase
MKGIANLETSQAQLHTTLLPEIAIIMGSLSDWEVMQHAALTLKDFGICYEAKVVSAHRTPDLLFSYIEEAPTRGIKIIIAGAGGAAHLPGMAAAKSILPILGVPINATTLNGADALYSIVQMPAGVPVGTLAIGKAGSINAAILAISILSLSNETLRAELVKYRQTLRDKILATAVSLP